MPTCSYVLFPYDDQKESLTESLQEMSKCEVQPAENEDAVLLVTETEDMDGQKEIENKLNDISSIRMLAQTFGEIVPDAGEVPTDE
jgi:nitrate reductase NapAB chaperone NapD